MSKINFKQPKYILPAILYLPIMFVGYMLIKTFHTEVADTTDPRLKTTDYLSSELPQANTDSVLGSKMDNTQDMFGKISDLSGVKDVENDNDSVNKKKDYESRYSDKEADLVARQQQAEQEEKQKLKEMQERVRKERKDRSNSDFVAPVSDSEIARVQRMRRQRNWEDMDRDLSGNNGGGYVSANGGTATGSSSSGISYDENGNPAYNPQNGSPYNESNRGTGSASDSRQDGEEQPEKVVKKVKETSDYFNTIGGSSEQSKLITAIIDENVKAVDGSRVRLRLLDDVVIGETTVKKGTYLYATMSGFGKQRVNGKVESVFFNEDIIKVSLTIYDTDGLEGLYVPQSSFKETTKDVISSAMQGSSIVDNSSTTSSTGIKSWANTAVQNASQRAMSALGTAAKKNRVRLKYGTRVYLVDESQKQGSERNKR